MKDRTAKKHKKALRKALSTLRGIERLGEENLVLLSPAGGKDRGHYLNHVRVYGYAEVFGTLRSVVNTCILALEDRIDLTLDIEDREGDVKRVLEFAKCLIPMEEGDYLDKMREAKQQANGQKNNRHERQGQKAQRDKKTAR